MTRETLLTLADRVEALAGPDRETDALIRAALFAPEGATVSKSPINGAWCVYHGIARSGAPRLFEPPRTVSVDVWRGEYTASIDAAMTLVPEGWRVSRLEEDWRSGRWHGQMSQRLSEKLLAAYDSGRTVGWTTSDTEVDGAATPAIALTIASLRARAEMLP